MTVKELVARVEARGAAVVARGDAVIVRPRGVLSEVERGAFQTRQGEILAHLRGRVFGADWTRVGLRALDRILEIEVPGWDLRLVLAPGCRVAREIRETDPKPGRVWCVCEILDLLTSGVSPEDARGVAEARITFDAEHQGVRKEAP